MKKKLLPLALGLMLCLGFTAGALAASGTKTIEISYQDIKLVVDGVQANLKDGMGNSVEPFIYNGTTYLPVRAAGEALGKEVTWDGNTKTVYIGKVPGAEENWMTKLPPYQIGEQSKLYDGSDLKSYFTASGEKHLLGVTFIGAFVNSLDSYAMWNTNAQYKTMTFTVANLDGHGENAAMEVHLNGEYSGISYDLKWDDPPKTITVPLDSEQDDVVAEAMKDPKVQKFTADMDIVKVILVKNKLVNLIVKPKK